MNFKAGGLTGEPSFYDPGDSAEKFALSSWITMDKAKIALAPEQVVEFKYSIKVPEGAEAGGHYGAVFFANEPESMATGSGVSVGSMIGTLLLVKVPGDITEVGSLKSFVSDKLIYFKNLVNFTAQIKNTGNIHIKPVGNITITNMFGTEVGKLKFNEQGGNVLPDSTRQLTNKWEPSGIVLGRYSADIALTYGAASNTISGTTSFWVFPIWFIITVSIVVLLILVLIIWLVVRGRKHKKSKDSPKVSEASKTEKDSEV